MAGILTTSLLSLSFVFVTLIFIFYLFVKSLYAYFEKRNIPYDKPTFPFGSFYSCAFLKKSFATVISDVYFKYKKHKLVGFYSFWKKQILIADPEIIKNILVKDFDVFADRGVYYNKQKDPLSAHLFALDGKEWKPLRVKITPTFTSGKIKGMFDTIVNCAEEMNTYVETKMSQDKVVDVLKAFSRYGLAVIANIGFGLDSDALKNDDSSFVKMVYRMLEPTVERFAAFMLAFNENLAKMLDARVTPKVVSDFFLGMVSETIKYRETHHVVRNDYLQLLLQLRESGLTNEEGEGYNFTNEEIAAQSFVFILAGSETTSATLSFCLYELALNKSVLHTLLTEVDSLTSITYDSINSLPYLDMVIDETLRKYPPLGFLNRVCSRDYYVPQADTTIEAGTQIFISIQGLHNDPTFFPEPEKFNPERFSKENREKIKQYTYMPFGEGPRFCIGMRFAKVTVKTALVTLLRRFQFRLDANVPIPSKIEPRTVITLPAGGMSVILEPRSAVLTGRA
ncbi:cytochrome P450 6k1-like [Macrosteles quadrilineatus]|uniref:cytochrome P450 6k1-like n=1 Tax=Macrosteles quadrilineatus TaxID=74068 RepID=UPI0023E22592|nr:cytochrome P450 6k1-like [Macrosteles quadrilineatus]